MAHFAQVTKLVIHRPAARMASAPKEALMQLNLNGISYTYPQATEPVLCGVSATFPQGWTGIVGDNGAGKTTLALVACGLLPPDTGSVTPTLVAAYCTQDATVPPDVLEDFALAYDGKATRLRRDLDIDDDWPWRYDTLSGGQQKRLQIACALWGGSRRARSRRANQPCRHHNAQGNRACACRIPWGGLAHFSRPSPARRALRAVPVRLHRQHDHATWWVQPGVWPG